jgi:Polyketide cyclase / dehydrase and lipid transport
MTRTSLPLIGLAACVLASPAFAVDVKKSVDVSASPKATWKAIGGFCGIGKWHPAIAKCKISKKGGATYRTLTLKGGGEVYEKKLDWDNAKKTYSYSIESSPLPVANYTANISVEPSGSGSTIVWTAHFDAKGAPDEKAAETIGGIFDAGLGSLKKELK